MLTTTARNAIQALQTCGVNAAGRSAARSPRERLPIARQWCSDRSRAMPRGERLQRRDKERHVAERPECELQRILQLGAFGFDVAMKARTQVRRDDEQAPVEFAAQRESGRRSPAPASI